MEFIIEKKSFLNELRKIQEVAEKNPIIPIVSCVQIEAKKKSLIISATNFEVGLIIEQKAKVNREGKIVIDARKVYEIIKEMPEGEICLNKKDTGWIEISHNHKIVFNVPGLSEEEFPPIETEEGIKFFTINAKNVFELIKGTIYAISEDKTRDSLRGILVEKQKKGIRMVATDGHRLALADRVFSMDEEQIIQKSVIIPKRGAREIKRLLEEKEESVKIGVGDKSLVIKGGEETVVIRLIEGEFPNYKKVIPTNNNNRVVIKTRELEESLRRVSLLAEEETKLVRFTIKSGTIAVSAKSIGFGDAREEKHIEYIGEDIEIGLNSRYVLDVLSTIEGEEVELEILDGKTPVLIKEKGKDCTIAVIMPMIL